MKIIKVAAVGTLWHISNHKFNSFDKDCAAQGVFWFSKDKDDLVKNWHGASINSREPIYLYQIKTSANNPAGWKEYDKLTLDQIYDMGYDSIDLGDFVIIFNSKDISIVNVEKIN